MLLTEAKQHLLETKPKTEKKNASLRIILVFIYSFSNSSEGGKKIATKKKSYIAQSRRLQPTKYKNPESFTVYLIT